MMFAKERRTEYVRVRGPEWNDIIRRLKRLEMMTGGWGLRVTDMPSGLTLSVDRNIIKEQEVTLAQIVENGPGGEPDWIEEGVPDVYGAGGYTYWVRKVVMTGLQLPAMPNQSRPWPLPSQFEFIAGGFWEPAINLAEVNLPPKCRHTAIEPYQRGIPETGETEPEGDVTDVDDADYQKGPIVPTWQMAWGLPDQGKQLIRVFCVYMPIHRERHTLETYGLDVEGCPDPSQWKRETALVLYQEDEEP